MIDSLDDDSMLDSLRIVDQSSQASQGLNFAKYNKYKNFPGLISQNQNNRKQFRSNTRSPKFRNNAIQSGQEDIFEHKSSMPKNSTDQEDQPILAHLSLRDNKIDASMLRRLKNKLIQGSMIKELDLSDNIMGDKGAKYLCEYFTGNSCIQNINVSNNGITEIGALRFLDMS